MTKYPRRVGAYIAAVSVLASAFLVVTPFLTSPDLPVVSVAVLIFLAWIGEFARLQARFVSQWFVSFTAIILVAAIGHTDAGRAGPRAVPGSSPGAGRTRLGDDE